MYSNIKISYQKNWCQTDGVKVVFLSSQRERHNGREFIKNLVFSSFLVPLFFIISTLIKNKLILIIHLLQNLIKLTQNIHAHLSKSTKYFYKHSLLLIKLLHNSINSCRRSLMTTNVRWIANVTMTTKRTVGGINNGDTWQYCFTASCPVRVNPPTWAPEERSPMVRQDTSIYYASY